MKPVEQEVVEVVSSREEPVVATREALVLARLALVVRRWTAAVSARALSTLRALCEGRLPPWMPEHITPRQLQSPKVFNVSVNPLRTYLGPLLFVLSLTGAQCLLKRVIRVWW